MKKSIYAYNGYKPYLIDYLGQRGPRSGMRSSLAKHLNCQTAFISQVLSGNPHLSLEQGFKVNSFINHDAKESDYFILLIQKNRAGTKELKDYFKSKIEVIQNDRLEISKQVASTQQISQEDQNTYYKNWYYLAIHMALSIPELQNKEALKNYFSLPIQVINKTLDFLTTKGLAVKSGDQYNIGPTHIHLKSSSDNILKHHSNWRIKALNSIERESKEDLHYSVVYSLSKKDALKIKEELIKTLNKNLETIAPSKEEVLYCHLFDFFKI